MSTRKVVYHPDPVLRRPTEAITVFDQDLKNLVSDMFDTMHAYKGIGLAAPQIGLSKKLLVISFEGRDEVLINPEIITAEGSEIMEEGCLSLPDVSVNVQRPTTINVIAKTITGEDITLFETGFFARIIQHEIDHLNGILIIDNPVEE